MKILYEKDANQDLIKNKKVAILETDSEVTEAIPPITFVAIPAVIA